MNKPLQKDVSFWIVAVTLVTVAISVQVQYGFPWLSRKIRDMKPAPRATADNLNPQNMGFIGVEEPLDTSKKTHSWQVPRSQPNLLETTPPQVVLIPTEYTSPSGGWTSARPDKAMGIRVPAQLVVQSAYSWPTRRTVWSEPAPPGQFDFIANLPSGGLKALQDEIKKQWGLMAEPQSFQTNVTVLKVERADAPGLKPADPVAGPQPPAQGTIRMNMASLVSILEQSLRVLLVDQTGFTGTYELPLTALQGPSTDRLQIIKKFLNEQMGLAMVETNLPVEFLVVRKAVAQ